MSRIKTYFVYPGDINQPTGGYHYDRRLISGLQNTQIEVRAISLPEYDSNSSAQTLAEIEKSFASFPDQSVVIVDGLIFGMLDSLAAKESRRLKLIALCHHPLALETGLSIEEQSRLFETEQRALHYTRAVIVTSENTRQILTAQFAVNPEKIIVAEPGTEQGTFARCNGNPLRLLTVASLIRRKAHDILIQSLSELKDAVWQARFVGDEHADVTWTEQLKAKAKALELSDRITFAGAVEDVRQEYLASDVFVLPSRFEGYGMVFAEAIAAGLPVIAARSGAIPAVVPDSAGVLVPTDDVVALTKVLRKVITDQSYRTELQDGARQIAASLPTWQSAANTVADKIREVSIS